MYNEIYIESKTHLSTPFSVIANSILKYCKKNTRIFDKSEIIAIKCEKSNLTNKSNTEKLEISIANYLSKCIDFHIVPFYRYRRNNNDDILEGTRIKILVIKKSESYKVKSRNYKYMNLLLYELQGCRISFTDVIII